MDGINGTSSTSYTNIGNAQPVVNVAPSTPPISNNYPKDSFTTSGTYSATPTAQSYPISQLMYESPSTASRLSSFFMDSSDKFLRVGSNWLGRTFINMLSGNIPFITSSAVSTQVSNNINTWLGRADLVRTGANPYQAMLLQDVGVKNLNDLSALRNAQDQATVAQLMTNASISRGQPVTISPSNVTAWVTLAQQLPKYF